MSRFVSALCGAVLALLAVLPGNAASAPSLGSSREPMRIMHFVLTGTVPLERAREDVNQAQAAGFTAVQVALTDGVRLDHAPWKPVKGAWTKTEFLSWAAYARAWIGRDSRAQTHDTSGAVLSEALSRFDVQCRVL